MMSGYLKETHVKDGIDINAIMRDMMSIILEYALDCELDNELGCPKCNYRNKDTRNRQKIMYTSYGEAASGLYL